MLNSLLKIAMKTNNKYLNDIFINNSFILKKLTITITSTAFIILLFNPNLVFATPDSFAPIIEKIKPAVVSIRAAKIIKEKPGLKFNIPPGSPFEDFFRRFNEPFQDKKPQQRKGVQLGSGFFIDSSGYVVTNNHVIDNTEEIEVITNDGVSYPAKLIGVDPRTDIALLKVDVNKYPSLKWGDSDKLRVGDWVLAIGNPHGLSSSVSLGIVSAKGRNINAGSYDDFIQIDAAINQGNSGGPLVSADGLVVGVNSLIFSPNGGSIGIGFAIPTSIVRDVVVQLKKYGKTRRGWLGVQLNPLTKELAGALIVPEGKGALIADIEPRGPAAKAGIKAGDVVLAFNKNRIVSSESLPIIVARAGVGHKARLIIWRNGKRLSFTVTLGHLESALAKLNTSANEKKEVEKANNESLGMNLSDIPLSNKKKLPFENKNEGILIDYVDVNGVSYRAGLRPGHVIIQVNNKSVSSVAEFISILRIERKKGNKSVAIRYFNGRTFKYTGVKLK